MTTHADLFICYCPFEMIPPPNPLKKESRLNIYKSNADNRFHNLLDFISLLYLDSNESLIAALQFDAYRVEGGLGPTISKPGERERKFCFVLLRAKGGANNRPIRLAVAYIIGADRHTQPTILLGPVDIL